MHANQKDMPLFGWKIQLLCVGLMILACAWLGNRMPEEAAQNWRRSLVDVLESSFDQCSPPRTDLGQISKHRGRSADRPPDARVLDEAPSPKTATKRKRITGHQMKVVGAAYRWRCALCSKQLGADFHVDHITPLHLGGAHDIKNFQPLCPPCHAIKTSQEQRRLWQ